MALTLTLLEHLRAVYRALAAHFKNSTSDHVIRTQEKNLTHVRGRRFLLCRYNLPKQVSIKTTKETTTIP